MSDTPNKYKVKVLCNFPSFQVDFGHVIKKYDFDSIRANGKIRFRCTTTNKSDGSQKQRLINLILYKDTKGFFFWILAKPVRVESLVAEVVNRFKLRKPPRTVVMCPKCRTPLKYIWRDNVNAIYDYIEAGSHMGVGDYHIEREYNMADEGNFDYVYCPNCQYTTTNHKKLRGNRKVPGEKYVDMDNVVDYFEFKIKE